MSQTLQDHVPSDQLKAGDGHVDGRPDAGISLAGAASFADLVRAHYAWAREAWEELDPDHAMFPGHADGAPRSGKRGRPTEHTPAEHARVEEDYKAKLERFERDEGPIQQAYWCARMPSAVALTKKRERFFKDVPLLKRLPLWRHPFRIHRVSNWVLPRRPHNLAELLQDCDALAIRASEILRGTPERIVMRSIYGVQSHVLGFVERTELDPAPSEVEEFVGEQKKNLAAITASYADAADKVARLEYVTGMGFGVLVLPLLALVAAGSLAIFGLLHPHHAGIRTFFACYTAGGVGAIVSVLMRMGGTGKGKFSLDPEVGRLAILVLGMFRPFIGAVFGVALYFLMKSSLVQLSGTSFYFFVTVAFIGGFNERWAKVMLDRAGDQVGGGVGATNARPPA